MTVQEIREAAKVMEAYANGKKIQCNDNRLGNGEWVTTDNPSFNWDKYAYRIKPESKYRPFKSQEECWDEMLKHQPFGWIYSKNRSCYYCIISVEEDRIELSPREQSRSETPLKEFYLKNYHCFFEEALELFKLTFADGTPFGIKEE